MTTLPVLHQQRFWGDIARAHYEPPKKPTVETRENIFPTKSFRIAAKWQAGYRKLISSKASVDELVAFLDKTIKAAGRCAGVAEKNLMTAQVKAFEAEKRKMLDLKAELKTGK